MRAYYVTEEGTETGACVIADTAKEAKKIAWNEAPEYFEDSYWCDVKVSWCKKADVSGLKKGVYEDWLDALRRDFFDSVVYADCPKCKAQETTVYYDKETGFYCNHCEDEPEAKKP